MNVQNRIAVVGMDSDRTGDDALIEALYLLAAGAIACAHLLFVIDPKVVASATDDPRAHDSLGLANAPRRIAQRAALLARLYGISVPHQRVVGHARIGDPTNTLLQMCVDYDADFLIVGTHRRAGLDRIFHGSVSVAAARRAGCAVIVARRKDYSDVERSEGSSLPYSGVESSAEGHGASAARSNPLTDSWPATGGPIRPRIV